MALVERLYARLPVPGQHLAVSAYGAYWHWLRFGPGYPRFVQDYRERERLDRERWRSYVRDRSRDLVRQAARQVPWYREHWTVSEKHAALAGALEDLPLLEKSPLRVEPRAFLRDDLRHRRHLVFHTSGSTGTPIASIWTAEELRNSLALREVRSVNWAGASFRQPRATFSGRMVVPDPAAPPPYYRFNVVERQAYLSAFHLRPDTAISYVEALRRHRIQWMTGYAVSFYLLGKFVLERGLSVPSLKAIVTTSEKLTPEMREVMEAAFHCRVFEEYSTVENAVFASECPEGGLHVSEDAGIIEILRPDGTPCDPGEAGEVVATCLMRELQPLVRFRLGDMAVWDPEPCSCGRVLPVLKEVVGRIEDVIIGPDGRRLVRFHGIFVDQPNVIEGQIVQEALRRIRVRVVPTEGFGADDVEDIARRVRQRVGAEIDVPVERVPHIARTAAGKFQAVVSLLREQGVAEAERTGGVDPEIG